VLFFSEAEKARIQQVQAQGVIARGMLWG